MKAMLQIVATLVAKPTYEKSMRDLLIPAVAEFRAEPGCEGYILLEDRTVAGRFLTYETWQDEAALAAHMKSPAMVKLEPLLKLALKEPIKQDFLTVLVELA